ncbi:hypothetical protein ICA16_00605 [Pseudomonas anatoliensis]|uniref:hypothetical protein n=1 Tax=Pseudomonas anatoliensis TaxID=2710589 RepID=UPI001B337430|nr:hypothetical protein [Pseudomonas anatoliensis]MBP5954154.1 hypothetical protein [Pseudomonas anatoliensis]
MKKPKFKSQISGSRTSSTFDSSVYFKDVEEQRRSPLQRFIYHRELLTTILGAEEDNGAWNMKSNLSIIGIVSSTESYFRSMIRNILLTVADIRKESYRNKLTYGAVLFHAPELLPEALLEESVFSSKKHIIDHVSTFLGIKVNLQQHAALGSALDEFDKVCHLRHCVAHRAGHLGSKNAIELGLDQFSAYLEKPISPTLDAVNNVFNICQNLVFEFNDFLFEAMLTQSVEKGGWSGDLRKDKREYLKLYQIFSSNPEDLNYLKSSYVDFRDHYGL